MNWVKTNTSYDAIPVRSMLRNVRHELLFYWGLKNPTIVLVIGFRRAPFAALTRSDVVKLNGAFRRQSPVEGGLWWQWQNIVNQAGVGIANMCLSMYGKHV